MYKKNTKKVINILSIISNWSDDSRDNLNAIWMILNLLFASFSFEVWLNQAISTNIFSYDGALFIV